MTTAVTVEDKQVFIRYILKNHTLKRRECVWILNYLISHSEKLHNIHFTEEVHHCPRGIVMTTVNVDSIPFRFFKGNGMTADADRAFHDIRLNPNEKFYIQINFPNKYTCPEYAAVHEENPHDTIIDWKQIEGDRKVAEEFLNHMSKQLHESALMLQIDEALDTGNKELFMQLTGELKTQIVI